MGTLSCLPKQNEVTNTGRYGTEKLPPLLPEMQAGNADRSRKLESNRYKKTGNLISICMPPCMGNTIAAVFFAYRLSLPKDFLRGFCCLPCSCNCLSLFRTLSLSGGALWAGAKYPLHEAQVCARGVFRSARLGLA